MIENIYPSMRGDNNRSVWILQEWLSLAGFRVKVDGDFGGATEEAVMKFQGSAGLPLTGTADVDTIKDLTRPLRQVSNFQLNSTSPADAVLQVAKVHLKAHPREVGGQNRGPWVRYYMHGNEGESYPWCCGFVTSVVRQALACLGYDVNDQKNGFPYVVSCTRLVEIATDRGWITTAPMPGDIFCIRSGGIYNHTGLVTSVNQVTKAIGTIEGNTNDEGSREGYEVCSRIRAMSDKAFIRIMPKSLHVS